jgi:hypothetical protein
MTHSLGMIVGHVAAGMAAEMVDLSFVFLAGALLGAVGVCYMVSYRDPFRSGRSCPL